MEDRSKTVLRVSHAHRHNTMPLVHKMSHCIGQICTDTVSLLWRNAKSSHRTMPRLVNHPSHQYDADHAPSSFRLMQVPGYTLLTLCEGIIGYSCCLLRSTYGKNTARYKVYRAIRAPSSMPSCKISSTSFALV